MMLNPRQGQIVQIWYRDRSLPFHGRIGAAVIVSRGRPRNHGIEIDGRIVVVPAGNLRKV